MFDFLVSKRKRQERIDTQARASLKTKLEFIHFTILADGAFTGEPIERIVGFFNYMEQELSELTEEELAVAPQGLKEVISNVGRNQYGWFRAPEGKMATNEDTFVQPTGHWDEFFSTLSIAKLLTLNQNKTDQGGFAPKPMTTLEFYNYKFVTPFILEKANCLEKAISELR